MASSADPYSAFNFLMEWNNPENGDTGKAGFQEVTGLGNDINVSKYREGGSNCFHMQQVTGVNKSTNITLKRGFMVAGDLYDWTESMRHGSGQARRNAIITMRDEAGQAVTKWNLTSVLPVKYTGPALNNKGNEIAIEELVLSVERLDIETSGIT